MRITILAIGSRGDVQPYVALGLGLQALGEVRVAARPVFEGFVREHGLDFWPVAREFRHVLEKPRGREWLDGRESSIRSWRAAMQTAAPFARQTTADCWRACVDADAIVVSPLGLLAGYHVAEKQGVPLVPAWYCPASPTRAYPVAESLLPLGQRLGGGFNLATHFVGRQLLWLLHRPLTNAVRREVLDLPPLPLRKPLWNAAERGLVLYGFSPAVVPPPPDWGPDIHVTGYWFLKSPPGWRPPAELAAFLEAGPPPVYVGFGSMPSDDPAALTQLVLGALRRAGVRGVLLGGWAGLGHGGAAPSGGQVDEQVFAVREVPHDWLFPRVAAVVHHGGAGTTAAGLRAGRPTVIVPHMVDQPFWGRRVAALGAGPAPIPAKELSVERLANAIHTAATDPQMRQRAAELGRRIAAEDGVARAVEAFRRYVAAGAAARTQPRQPAGATPHAPAKVSSQSSRFG